MLGHRQPGLGMISEPGWLAGSDTQEVRPELGWDPEGQAVRSGELLC